MKKAMVIIVAMMLAMVCLSGCTNTNDNPNESKPPVTITDYTFPDLPAKGAYDFGGQTMTVVSYHGQAFEQRGDFMRRYTQDLQIEDRFNVKIAYSTDFDKHLADAIAGAPSADVGYIPIYTMPQYVKSGGLEPLQDYSEQLKLETNDRYDKQTTEWGTVNGNIYALGVKAEELWLYHDAYPMFMNIDLLEERGIKAEEIYAAQENKTWTWDMFKEKAKQVTQDLNGDGVPEIYGTTVGGAEVLEAFMVSNGTNYVVHKDGKFVFDVDSKGITTMNYIRDLVADGAARTTEANGGYPYTQDQADFVSGKIGFQPIVFQRTWAEGGLKDMTYKYGVLTIPMGPDVEDYYILDKCNPSYSMYAQPNKEHAKEIAEFMYLYTTSLYESEEDENTAFWDEANNRIFDEGSAYFLERVFEQTNVVRVNNYMFTVSGLGLIFNIDAVVGGTKTAQQVVEEVTAPCQDFIDKLFVA